MSTIFIFCIHNITGGLTNGDVISIVFGVFGGLVSLFGLPSVILAIIKYCRDKRGIIS